MSVWNTINTNTNTTVMSVTVQQQETTGTTGNNRGTTGNNGHNRKQRAQQETTGTTGNKGHNRKQRAQQETTGTTGNNGVQHMQQQPATNIQQVQLPAHLSSNCSWDPSFAWSASISLDSLLPPGARVSRYPLLSLLESSNQLSAQHEPVLKNLRQGQTARENHRDLRSLSCPAEVQCVSTICKFICQLVCLSPVVVPSLPPPHKGQNYADKAFLNYQSH